MLSKIENGGTSPSLSTLKALARALNVPLTELLRRFRGAPRLLLMCAPGPGLHIERRGTKSGHRYELLGHSLSAATIVVEPYLITLSEDAEAYVPLPARRPRIHLHADRKGIYRHADKLYPMTEGNALFFDAGRPARPGGVDRAAHDVPLDHHLPALIDFPHRKHYFTWVDGAGAHRMLNAAIHRSFPAYVRHCRTIHKGPLAGAGARPVDRGHARNPVRSWP